MAAVQTPKHTPALVGMPLTSISAKDGWRQKSSLEGLNKEECNDVAGVCCQHKVDGIGPYI